MGAADHEAWVREVGERRVHPDDVQHPSGMIRGSTEGKVDYRLAMDGPMFDRWAELLTNAAERKGKRNWMNACTEEDLERFLEGFARHARQYLRGDDDEDHAAAIMFNLNGAEYVRERLREQQRADTRQELMRAAGRQ
jgi:hypothetical protein